MVWWLQEILSLNLQTDQMGYIAARGKNRRLDMHNFETLFSSIQQISTKKSAVQKPKFY